MKVKLEVNLFKDALNRYNQFVKKNKRDPRYVLILGKKCLIKDFRDAKIRFERFIRMNKRLPVYVTVELDGPAGDGEVVVRNPALKPLRDALGDFRTATEWYHRVQEGGDYDYYYNDVHSVGTEVQRVVSGAGLNCVDWSQLTVAVLNALREEGKRYSASYLHVKCYSRKLNSYALGHVLLEVSGEEFKKPTIMDLAAAASSGAPIGDTMCTYGYKVQSKNPSWLDIETLK